MSQCHIKSRSIYGHRNSGQLCQFYSWGIRVIWENWVQVPQVISVRDTKKRISKSLTLNFVSNEAHLGFKL